MQQIIERVAEALKIGRHQVAATVQLLDEGNTIAFIARYRKEMTGNLDETLIREIAEQVSYQRQLEEKKHEVIERIEQLGHLTEELRRDILAARKMQEVEDLYRPFRPKRKTRASLAQEKGLTPLAEWLVGQTDPALIKAEAEKYVNAENGLTDAEAALQGAVDILAERVADDPEIRRWARQRLEREAVLQVTRREGDVQDEKGVYAMYYAFEEAVSRIAPHRVLAINRGEKEGVLRVRLSVEEEPILRRMRRRLLEEHAGNEWVSLAIADGYKRLLFPALEREIRGMLTERAEEQAIRVFAKNVRQLLLQPPIRKQPVLAIDPAYRTGCKWAVVDPYGKLLEVGVFYPTPPQNRVEEARAVLREKIDAYGVRVIAIGNGTASRETEWFVAETIARSSWSDAAYVLVSEAGASVYSASPLAKEEFPDLDVSERSAVSIARRLQDPLAELVKIDPKSIGVGQYQHDVSPKKLTETLEYVVSSAVNYVGVDLNTASVALLKHVSGLNAAVAKNIVAYREENGPFQTREDLKKVPRLGAKSFEQAVGFLRIPDGVNPLDRTPIHPESYGVVKRLCERLSLTLEQVDTPAFRTRLEQVDPRAYAALLSVGEPTLRDILDSLKRPGRDPREALPPPIFQTHVLSFEDLRVGMKLRGTVRNVVDFGAFVDIGIKQDGLVHISRMSDQYVRHPMDVVSVGDIVDVWVVELDEKRGRVGLSMVSGEAIG